MITARNYAAQCERGLRELIAANVFTGTDKVNVTYMANTIAKAQHFVLPDGGVIIEQSGLKGMEGLEARLPYPAITVEYYVNPEELDPRAPEPAHKRVIIATEVDCNEALTMLAVRGGKDADEVREVFAKGGVHVASAVFIQGLWVPLTAGFLIRREWDQRAKVGQTMRFSDNDSAPLMTGFPTLLMPTAAQQTSAKFGGDQAYRDAVQDIAGEVAALFNLLEALACSNVSAVATETVNATKNAKRVAAGKLPIYETKHLVIDTHRNKTATGGQMGPISRNGMRQHLRRGHIRRLDETRRIWVNACVVAADSAGRIDKTYKVA